MFFKKKNCKKHLINSLLASCERNIIRESNRLDPDQDGHSVGLDIGPNCLQTLSADDKIATRKERVKHP